MMGSARGDPRVLSPDESDSPLVLLAVSAMPTIRAVAQQAVVTDENVSQMIGNAKTPAEHEAIATFFDP